jgi:hypothetical protein
VLAFKKSKVRSVHERGRWCNICGIRLITDIAWTMHPAMPGAGVRGMPSVRTRWLTIGGVGPSWSLCDECFETMVRCSLCALPVGTEGLMHDGGSHLYCPRCFRQKPRCDTCGRPMDVPAWKRVEGRPMCGRCRQTVVADPDSAHALYRRVRSQLIKLLDLRLDEPCQLKIAGQRQMLGLLDKSALLHLDAGSRGRCFGLFLREGNHRAIFVEEGLPQIVLLEVLAHEYAHAWQSEHCPSDLPLLVQEGFAEWVSYKLLQKWGCRKRLARMLRRDDIYGRGLRKMLAWERDCGTQSVLRRVMSS